MLHSSILGIDEMLLDVTIRMKLMESDVSGNVVFIMGPFSLAMHERGKIHIHIGSTSHKHGRCSSCHDEFDGDYVVLEIRDNGPGISEEIPDKIFQPFFTTKERAENSGLGLSVVHGIIHSQQGHIVVKNSSTGATFRIYLPPALGAASEQIESHSKTQLIG
jgi:nitrogen-specific signal transduction histidine kinase